jgi:hypothetical protein
MLPPEAYEKLIAANRALIDELNEVSGGRAKVSSPYILVVARKPRAAAD